MPPILGGKCPHASFRFSVLLGTLLLAPAARAQEDVAAVPAQDLTVAKVLNQRYFLVGDAGRKAPEAGFGLVIVMPGGPGTADFLPFVRRIYKNALSDGYLIAQLVAVPSKNPNQIVWPTAKTKDAKQSFTTETFITNVVGEITAKHKINRARVFTLSWSSGGPAAYVASMMKDTPVRSSLVAMSVFPQHDLKQLAAAKGQRYYLLHSPQDQVTMYSHARTARTQLTSVGADVHVADYEGGHGWKGDVFGNIAAGIEWLQNHPATATTAPAASIEK